MLHNKILIVDDDPNIREVLQVLLSSEGFDVTTADGGEEALRKQKDLDPDLVILDIMMPEMDGVEVCARIRSRSAVPILFLTALDTEKDEVAGLGVGAAGGN